MLVATFNEQPAFLLVGTSRALSCPDQREATAQLRAMEHHVDFAAGKLLARRDAVSRLVSARGPHHYRSGSVLPFRYYALELGIFERMILGAVRLDVSLPGSWKDLWAPPTTPEPR